MIVLLQIIKYMCIVTYIYPVRSRVFHLFPSSSHLVPNSPLSHLVPNSPSSYLVPRLPLN